MKKTKIFTIMTIMLIGILVFTAVFIPQHALADNKEETIYVGDFNLYTYRADLYTKSDTVCNKIINNMLEAVYTTFPSRVVVDYLDNEKDFQKKVIEWKALNFVTKPSGVVDDILDEKGYYEAIIMSVFYAEQVQNDDVLYDAVKEVNAESNKLISMITKYLKEVESVEFIGDHKMSNFSKDVQKDIKKRITDEFKKSHPNLDFYGDVEGIISDTFDTLDGISDAVNHLAAYSQVASFAEGSKAVLMKMYEECPLSDMAMKGALYEVALSMDDYMGAVSATLLNTEVTQAGNIIGVLADEGWKAIINSNPYSKAFMAGASIGTVIGTSICNALFSTDETIEQYEKMKCLSKFSDLISQVVVEMGINYEKDRTTQNASNYFKAIEALFSTGDLSCEFANKYAKILYEDSFVGWIQNNKSDYDGFVSSVNSIRDIYASEQIQLMVCYYNELEVDYPEIWAILFGCDESDYVAVDHIKFNSDSIKIGMDDFVPYLEAAVVYPNNADNKNVTYTSSDKSILEINPNGGVCTPHREGTVTITATSEDGGFTDTIEVTVVAGSMYQQYEYTIPGSVEAGQCGDNVRYTWNKTTGEVVISGRGEMWNYGYHDSPFYDSYIESIAIRDGITSIGERSFECGSSLKSVEISNSVISIGERAFSGCSSLTSVEIPNSLTSIGNWTFENCSSLTSVEIPNSVTSIGFSAFENCSSLTSVEIPNSVTSIGGRAFEGCSSLTSVKIPNSVASIGDYAFSGCISLISVENSVTDEGAFEGYSSLISVENSAIGIGTGAFSGCSSLTSVEIPNSVIDIGGSAFRDCSNLISVEIPNSVISVGGSAFSGCSSLTSIEIPNNVTWIGGNVFSGCSSLSSVEIPNSVTSIGDYAFEYCSSLTSIEIPNSVTLIGKYVFYHCSSLTSVEISNNVTDIGDCVFSNCTSLKSVKIPDSVMSIGWSAFRDCSSLISIEIQNNVISIDDYAFEYCSSLTSVEIPNSVISIGDYVFHGCSSLTSVEISNNVTSIGDSAFYYCSSLTGVNIPNSVTSIGNYVFSGCSSLTSVKIPNSVTGIGRGAFSGCSSLTNVEIPNSVTSIEDYTFEDCSSITSVEIPNGVTSIGDRAFNGCSNITNIEISNSVTSIGDKAFSSCSSLTSIEIPNSVMSIGENAFYCCSSLTSVENSVTDIGDYAFSDSSSQTNIKNSATGIGDGAFVGCSSLTSVKIPNSITSIGRAAFGGCSNLTNVEIPDSVTNIGTFAFNECSSLASIKIPNSVTSIGNYVFYKCNSLTSVEISNNVTSIGDSAFHDCSRNLVIFGISGSTAETYANNNNIKFIDMETGCKHSYEESITKSANCTEAGVKTYICSICGDTYTESIPATGHTEVIDDEIPATYESEGKTEGSHCSVCGTIIKAQQTIPKLEHNPSDETSTGWSDDGFWYENGVKQGVQYNEDGSIDLSYRGKEIYDPVSNAWYWLDNIQNGAVAKSKDVYQESAAGAWADNKVYNEDGSLNTDASTGKWVRYDENGHMIKGWNTNGAGTYYFDTVYGTMAKGHVVIGDNECYFDENTGIGYNGWLNVGGMDYWYENGIRQGYNVNDKDYRGKEIYDAASDAWYWLDNVQNGAVAKSKDVYQESYAGIFADREDGTGKWVRYDADGHMIKGWSEMNGNTYYFDYQTGAMAKGWADIDGVRYYFNKETGIRE